LKNIVIDLPLIALKSSKTKISVDALSTSMNAILPTQYDTVLKYVFNQRDHYDCKILDRICQVLGLHVREILNQKNNYINSVLPKKQWVQIKVDYLKEECNRISGEIGLDLDLELAIAELIRCLDAIALKTENVVIPTTIPTQLNQSQLAARLGVSKITLAKKKTLPNFREWSKGKDPNGLEWMLSPNNSCLFTRLP
jgi:hypothetical protein